MTTTERKHQEAQINALLPNICERYPMSVPESIPKRYGEYCYEKLSNIEFEIAYDDYISLANEHD